MIININFIGKYNGYLLFIPSYYKNIIQFLSTLYIISYKNTFFATIMEVKQQNLTPNEALQKLKHYCAYQERCHKEVKEKLYSYGLYGNDLDQCISTLIEENYLNEERFAIAYAGGKMRVKQWGKVKIKYNLKQKNVSEYCIKKALASIDEELYLNNFQNQIDKKLASLKSEKNIFIKKRKVKDALQLQGYELDLIFEKLKQI